MPYDLMSFFYSPQVEAQKAQMGKMQVQEAQMQLEDQKRLRDARQSMDLSELSNYVDESSTPELKAALTDFAIAQKSGVPSAIKDAETQVANIRQKTAMSQKEGIDAQMQQLDFIGRQISYFKENPSPDSLNTVVYNLMRVSPQQAQQAVQTLAKMGIQPNPITNRYDNIPPQSMGALKQYVDAQERLGLSAKEKFEQQYKMLDLQERINQRKEDRAARVEHWKATEQKRNNLMAEEGAFTEKGDMSTFKSTSGKVYRAETPEQEDLIANLNQPVEKGGVYERRGNMSITSAAEQAEVLGQGMQSFLEGKTPATLSTFAGISENTITGALTANLNRAASDDENLVYQQLMAPAKKIIPQLEQAGYQSNAATMQAVYDSIIAKSDAPMIVRLQSLGELGQQTRKALEAVSTSTTTNQAQREGILKAYKVWEKAIPFNQNQVIDYWNATKKTGEKPTLKGLLDFIKPKEVRFKPDPGWKPTSQSQISAMDKAMQAIANGTDREAVINRLREHGIMVK